MQDARASVRTKRPPWSKQQRWKTVEGASSVGVPNARVLGRHTALLGAGGVAFQLRCARRLVNRWPRALKDYPTKVRRTGQWAETLWNQAHIPAVEEAIASTWWLLAGRLGMLGTKDDATHGRYRPLFAPHHSSTRDRAQSQAN